MGNAGEDSADLVTDFVTESREHLATVETDLLRLEQGGADAETVNKVFRCVHSVKGVAGFLGFERINQLAHMLESTLDLVRKGRLQPSGSLVEVLLAAIDRLGELVEKATESNGMGIEEHLERLRAYVEVPEVGSPALPTAPQGAVEASPQDPPALAAPGPAASPISNEGPKAPAPAGHGSGHGEVADSVRVGVGLLDRLMNLSGELVLGRNQLLQALSSASQKGIELTASRLNQVVSEMQEAIMQTRLQPVGNVFQKFPRVVRDLSAKLGKRCRLVVEGKDVELDRSILEALGDPLTHLVRNSIDHGIEKPEARQLAGKPVEGTLQLQAFHMGGNVRIQVIDDGGGIDPDRLRKKAVEKGVITTEQARTMSERDAVMLIFAAGFSTAEKVTDVSGRGVGMDVVRTNIEKIGGSIDVHSLVGRGTTIQITIPLTLAILPALVVWCGERRYVLPQANVSELVRIRSGEGESRIMKVEGSDVLRLRGKLVPIVHLREALCIGKRNEDPNAVHNIMVVETGSVQYGLVVDTPPDAEEIVVKPLGRHLKDCTEYAGSTILGDGRVAMILDVSGIASSANLLTAETAESDSGRAERSDAGAEADEADLVLFRNHPTELFAIPLGLLSRIERFERSKVKAIAKGLVYSGENRAMPLIRLDAAIDATPVEASGERLSVLVLRIEEHEFGLIAPIIEDIRNLRLTIDEHTLAGEGILGSFQLQGNTVRLLDVAALAHKALPTLFTTSEKKPRKEEKRGPARVLFAEDSSFFRGHVQRMLETAGFEVTAAEDGDLAWQQLEAEGAEFDLVVTDVQMPNCDGLELARRIRRSEKWRTLPVLALTSLSSQEDVEAGKAAGITDYRIKLDDAALLAVIRQLLGGKA